jgi:hypothetical protein
MPRPMRLAGVLVMAAALLVVTGGCSRPAPADSGVRGVVRIGPTAPVQREGVPADAPYAAALLVRDASGAIVARAQSAADGAYSVDLAPGEYTIEGVGGNTLPRPPAPQAFAVRAHEFAVVALVYDTGIR